MNIESINPFPLDADRYQIWEMLMRRDYEAFLLADWSQVEPDFLAEDFHGVDGAHLFNPDHWRLRFPDLTSYRDSWLTQAADFKAIELKEISKLDFLFQASVLRDIEIAGVRAIAHKKFDGRATTTADETVRLLWQTVYFMRKVNERWLINGFVGYLPISPT